MELALAQHTDPGVSRSENQDAMGSFESDVGTILVVCDGLGGHEGGALASRTAVDAVGAVVEAAGDLGMEAVLRECVNAANRAVREAATAAELEQAGTTMVMLGVNPTASMARTMHLGDSRAYLIRDDEIRQLTADHASSAESGGRVTRALGMESDVEGELGRPVGLREHDVLLLCTDGLTTMMDDEVILRMAREYPYSTLGEALIELANARGGYDNITVQVMHVGEPPARATASESGLARLADLQAATEAEAIAEASSAARGGSRQLGYLLLALAVGLVFLLLLVVF